MPSWGNIFALTAKQIFIEFHKMLGFIGALWSVAYKHCRNPTLPEKQMFAISACDALWCQGDTRSLRAGSERYN